MHHIDTIDRRVVTLDDMDFMLHVYNGTIQEAGYLNNGTPMLPAWRWGSKMIIRLMAAYHEECSCY